MQRCASAAARDTKPAGWKDYYQNKLSRRPLQALVRCGVDISIIGHKDNPVTALARIIGPEAGAKSSRPTSRIFPDSES